MAKVRAPKGIAGRTGDAGKDSGGLITRAHALYLERRRLVTGSGIGVLVIVLALVGYGYIRSQEANQAAEHLGGIILEYEAGNYRLALDGTGGSYGLLDIVDRYGSTDAGNIARFYAGDALFRLGDYAGALDQFEAYNAAGDIVGASATAGRAAVHEAQGEYVEAGDLYLRAAGMYDNGLSSPPYLLAAARAYGAAGAYENAENAILQAKEQYPDNDLADEFDYRLGYVRARMN